MLFTLFHSRLANHTLLHWFLSSLSKLRWNIFLTNMIQRRFEQICLGHYWIRTDNLLEDPPTPSLSGSWQMAEPPDNSQKLLSTHIFWCPTYAFTILLDSFWIYGNQSNTIEICLRCFSKTALYSHLLTSTRYILLFFWILLEFMAINQIEIFLRYFSETALYSHLLTSNTYFTILLDTFWIYGYQSNRNLF